jgi:very-short-patch-repair endonuclease
VFSTLRAEQLDLSRTQALGVRDLKHFLEFAERGPRALAEATKGSLGGFESPFEEAVAAALASKGWEVHTQIGASSFRVDLAVVHPDARGTYLCGVECDGATYHRSATARDRDMLREQVLRGLGWEILRVWSTDWWIDRAGTFEKVHHALTGLLERSRATRAKEQELLAAKQSAEDAIAKAQEGAAASTRDEVAHGRPDAPQKHDAVLVQPSGVELQEPVYARNESARSETLSVRFIEADPRSAVDAVNPELFFDRTYDDQLRRMVEHVAEVEGPVLDAVLARRIARSHGWQRTGARIQERVTALAAKVLRSTDEDVGVFFWSHKRGPEAPVRFRVGGEDARGVEEVCLAELVALARTVSEEGKSGDMAVSAMAQALGLRHVRAANRIRLEKALAAARDA